MIFAQLEKLNYLDALIVSCEWEWSYNWSVSTHLLSGLVGQTCGVMINDMFTSANFNLQADKAKVYLQQQAAAGTSEFKCTLLIHEAIYIKYTQLSWKSDSDSSTAAFNLMTLKIAVWCNLRRDTSNQCQT